jgi:hypothetical protein
LRRFPLGAVTVLCATTGGAVFAAFSNAFAREGAICNCIDAMDWIDTPGPRPKDRPDRTSLGRVASGFRFRPPIQILRP